MINYFKDSFSKKKSLFLGVLILFLIFLPSVSLAFWTIIRDVLLFLPSLFIATILVVCITITQGLALLVGAILNWVISPSFISLSYTKGCKPPDYTPPPPDCNPIIGMGLNITQGFVNILLVLALVYTALSLALRIDETEAKRMLVRLIIVALLVNFAPVFCGLVIDGTNIVMNYFLTGIRGEIGNFFSQAEQFLDATIKSIWGAGGKITERLGVLALGISMIVLNIGVIIAFVIFGSIFILRYLSLWILVILSPIAFAGWVFPAQKVSKEWEFLDWILFPFRMLRGFWDKWLKEFTEWAIIGIPMAFFLYLGIGSFTIFSEYFTANLEAPGIEPTTIGIFNQIFPYFVTIIFLLLGFSFGLQTSAYGAQAAIETATRGLRGAGARIRALGSRARAIPAVSRAEERLMKRLEKTPVVGRIVGGPGAYEQKRAARLNEARKEMEAIPATPEGNKALLARITRRPLSLKDREQRVAAIETLAKRKALSDEVIKEISRYFLEFQQLGGSISTVYKARPDLAQYFGMSIPQVMAKIEPGEFWKTVQADALRNSEVVYQAALDERKFTEFSRNATPDAKMIFKDTLKKITPRKEDREIMKERIKSISTDPRWFPTEEEIKAAKEEEERERIREKIVPGTEEEFRKAREKYGPKAFG